MYLSNLKIHNFRSIADLNLEFKKGKNIIVGKNNSGKSNIIKAIDLILGEQSPTYHKSENITENDYNNGNTKEPILIYCELKRDENEKIDYEALYNCFGFKINSKIINWVKNDAGKNIPIKEPTRVSFNPINLHDFWIQLNSCFEINEDTEGVNAEYINPKLKNQKTFETQFENKYLFAFGYRASYYDLGKILKEIRFFFKEKEDNDWIMAFSAPIRNELIQSAIIPAFRDPSNELRINQWSWYGKLLKTYIKSDTESLKKAFEMLKGASSEVFSELETKINDSNVKVAFPDTKISFQFNPDTKVDVYKSALIYVDDGFNSLLQNKGAGIQSAVIIGLFDYYTRYISCIGSSLLAIEEPELYLHPQARRIISNRLEDFLDKGKNQVIVSTHASEFLTTTEEKINIIVVNKNKTTSTTAYNTEFTDSKEKQILLKSQNLEMFFADKVILVEGGDKFILESLARYYGKYISSSLGENWLNDRNISIISVGGKTEFWKYCKKLKQLNIDKYVLADFDFFLRKLPEFFTNLELTRFRDRLNGILGKIGCTSPTLNEDITNVIDDFSNNIREKGLVLNTKEIKRNIREPLQIKRLHQISENVRPQVIDYLDYLRKSRMFVLSGELEDFYSEKCKTETSSISGKEEKAVYIVSNLVSSANPIVDFINADEFFRFFKLVSES